MRVGGFIICVWMLKHNTTPPLPKTLPKHQNKKTQYKTHPKQIKHTNHAQNQTIKVCKKNPYIIIHTKQTTKTTRNPNHITNQDHKTKYNNKQQYTNHKNRKNLPITQKFSSHLLILLSGDIETNRDPCPISSKHTHPHIETDVKHTS